MNQLICDDIGTPVSVHDSFVSVLIRWPQLTNTIALAKIRRMMNHEAVLSAASIRLLPDSITCVVVDLDGVLFEGSNEGYFDAHEHALRAAGLQVSRQEMRERILGSWSHPHSYQLALFIKDAERHAVACDAYEEFLFSENFAARVRGIAGARRAVTELHGAGFTLAIATGMHYAQIRGFLKRIDIDPVIFAAAISGYQISDSALQKPNPFMLTKIMSELGAISGGTLYVGDSKSDIRMARAANVLSVAVLTGNMSREDAELELADLILPSIAELGEILQGRGLPGTLR